MMELDLSAQAIFSVLSGLLESVLPAQRVHSSEMVSVSPQILNVKPSMNKMAPALLATTAITSMLDNALRPLLLLLVMPPLLTLTVPDGTQVSVLHAQRMPTLETESALLLTLFARPSISQMATASAATVATY